METKKFATEDPRLYAYWGILGQYANFPYLGSRETHWGYFVSFFAHGKVSKVLEFINI
jgi:hypothetical protein